MDKVRLDGRLEEYWVCYDLLLSLSILLISYRADSISGMKDALDKLRTQLGSDPEYFEKVYKYTFDFARNDGQRSLGEIQISYIILRYSSLSVFSGLETAQAFWSLLIPHGLVGGALTRIEMEDDGDEDVAMDEDEEGWKEEYLQWWFDFLNARSGKGVTKDTWIMVCTFSHQR